MADHAGVAGGDEVDLSRRKFLTRATIATGAVGAVFAAIPFLESWSPSERARAPRSGCALRRLSCSCSEAASTSAIIVERRLSTQEKGRRAQALQDGEGHGQLPQVAQVDAIGNVQADPVLRRGRGVASVPQH